MNAVAERILRADGDDLARLVTVQDQVAQVALRRAADEALLGHPEVVEHLGEIFVAAVADERDHPLRAGLLAAITQRRRQQRAGGRSAENAFLPQQFAGGGEGFLVGMEYAAPTRDRSAMSG